MSSNNNSSQNKSTSTPAVSAAMTQIDTEQEISDPRLNYNERRAIAVDHCSLTSPSKSSMLDELVQGDSLENAIFSNTITHSDLLEPTAERNVKWASYIRAVIYTTSKLAGIDQVQCWLKTLTKAKRIAYSTRPYSELKHQALAYANQVNVKLVYERIFVPFWLSNTHTYQKAIDAQAFLMENAKSELVRTQAANSILTHLKPPEVSKVEVEHKTDDSTDLIVQLHATTMALAAQQQKAIKDKVIAVTSLAAQKDVLEGSFTENNE